MGFFFLFPSLAIYDSTFEMGVSFILDITYDVECNILCMKGVFTVTGV
jgi:hypothetical protein